MILPIFQMSKRASGGEAFARSHPAGAGGPVPPLGVGQESSAGGVGVLAVSRLLLTSLLSGPTYFHTWPDSLVRKLIGKIVLHFPGEEITICRLFVTRARISFLSGDCFC